MFGLMGIGIGTIITENTFGSPEHGCCLQDMDGCGWMDTGNLAREAMYGYPDIGRTLTGLTAILLPLTATGEDAPLISYAIAATGEDTPLCMFQGIGITIPTIIIPAEIIIREIAATIMVPTTEPEKKTEIMDIPEMQIETTGFRPIRVATTETMADITRTITTGIILEIPINKGGTTTMAVQTKAEIHPATMGLKTTMEDAR
jgi:hypothetical protein